MSQYQFSDEIEADLMSNQKNYIIIALPLKNNRFID